MSKIVSVKELQAKIALAEGAKASAAMRVHEAAEAEKKALLKRLSKPSGLSDEEVAEKASIIINHAVENGMTSVQVFRFPNHFAPTTDAPSTKRKRVGKSPSLAFPRKCLSSGSDSCSHTATAFATRLSTTPTACQATSVST